MDSLQGKRMLVFVGPDYEDLELQYPRLRLAEAGAEVVVAGLEAGATYRGKHGYPQKAEVSVEEVDPGAFDGLVVPGGFAPDKLRRSEAVKRITRTIAEAEKCVASICHGPWVNISAGIVEGRTYTSSPALRDDLRNAGARWVDEGVVVDRNHVSSRGPDDLPAFCRTIIEMVGEREATRV